MQCGQVQGAPFVIESVVQILNDGDQPDLSGGGTDGSTEGGSYLGSLYHDSGTDSTHDGIRVDLQLGVVPVIDGG